LAEDLKRHGLSHPSVMLTRMTFPFLPTVTRGRNDDIVQVTDEGHVRAVVQYEDNTTVATRGRETMRLPTTRAGLSALAAFVDDGLCGVDPQAPVSHPFSLFLIDKLTQGLERTADLIERYCTIAVAEQMRAEGLLVPPVLYTTSAMYDRYYNLDLSRSYAGRVACARLDLEGAKQKRPPGVHGTVQQWFSLLKSWPGSYSPDGRPYRSLLRTLPIITAEIPPVLLARLSSVRLERPLSLMQLACVLARHEVAPLFEPYRDHDITLLMRTSESELSELMHIASMLTVTDPKAPLVDRARALGQVLSSIYLPSRRSLRRVVRNYRQLVLHLGPEIVSDERRLVKTARPPIALPRAPGVRFLDDVGAILDEGERMDHCAARYVVPAVRGELFLFHVRKGGARATIAVAPDGNLFFGGPKNKTNAACEEAIRVVGAWAADLAGACAGGSHSN
jgi:hypothetical protein